MKKIDFLQFFKESKKLIIYLTWIVSKMDKKSEQMTSQAKRNKELLYSREEYGTKDFWESRYKQNSKTYFDWYAEYPELKETLEGQYCIQKTNSILMLGCGNSKLSDQMYEAGYQDILNIDISPSVIEQMKQASIEKGYDLNKIKWETMDATNMQTVKDNSIDVLIDKGTLDALISGGDMEICVKMLKESMRVMRKDGQFIMITYGSPEGRKKFFEAAVGFQNYDYYTTKVDLSTQSTLINLMRSNLGKKPLSSITQDPVAMKQSMLQFNLIKVLRRNRKNEKKYIVWANYEKKEQNIDMSEFQDKKIIKNDKKEQKNIQQKKQQSQKTQKKTSANKQEDEVVYNPMKQCFCYVYSIRHKFASDMDQLVPPVTQELVPARCQKSEGFIVLPGDQSLKSLGVYAEGDAYIEILRALKFLDICGISNNPVTLYSSYELYQQKKEDHSVRVQLSDTDYAPLYSKTVLEVSLPIFDGNLTNVENLLKKCCSQIIEEGGIKLHPQPKIYGFLGILMQKLGKASSGISKFLNKYWYPTWTIHTVDSKQKIAKYLVSVPPSAQISSCKDILMKICRIKEDWIKVLKQGTVNTMQPRIFGVMNLCTVTFCEGKSFNLRIQQFQNIEGNYKCPKQPTLSLRKQILAKSMARLFSSL